MKSCLTGMTGSGITSPENNLPEKMGHSLKGKFPDNSTNIQSQTHTHTDARKEPWATLPCSEID